MVNEQETLKELKKFCYKSMNKLWLIPIGIFVMIPAVTEVIWDAENGYLMSVITAIALLIFIKIRNNWAADELKKLLAVVKEDGLYEVLLQVFAKNKNNLFYNVMLGNYFIIEKNGGSLLMMMPYRAIGSLQLHVGENIEGELRASIRISSNDKRYQRRGIAQPVLKTLTPQKLIMKYFASKFSKEIPMCTLIIKRSFDKCLNKANRY